MGFTAQLVITAVIYVLYKFLRAILHFVSEYRSTKQALDNVGCMPTHWFWGHTKDTLKNQRSQVKRQLERIEKFPKAVVRWIGPVIHRLAIYYPSTIQVILNTEEPKDPFGYSLFIPWIGDGLLLSSGKKWRRNRKLLTAAFHFDMLKGYLVDFNETTATLLEKWKRLESISVFEDVGLMTLDSMLKCAMSAVTDCQHIGTKHPYIKAVHDISWLTLQRYFNPLKRFDFIYYNFTAQGREFLQAAHIAHTESETRIKARKSEIEKMGQPEVKHGKKLNFLDILLLARDDKGKGLSDREIRDEVDTFLFEGHDTTASGLSWALYNLARHPEYQDKCRKEIVEVMGDRNEVQLADLNKLHYLTMCIKESLRLHPPVFSISRQLENPLHFPTDFGPDQYNVSTESVPSTECSKTFPEKSRIEIRILSLHRNPNVWENPDIYNPDRFTPENSAKRSPFAFIPFSAGPRNCIGQNFAMMEMKVALAILIKNLRFEVDKNFPTPEIKLMIVLRAENDIHLKVTRIEQSGSRSASDQSS